MSLQLTRKTINQHPLHYVDQGTGPVLLFCHGLLASSQMWQAQIIELSTQYRCIAVDFWGHGQSTTLPEHCENLQDVAKDLLNLMDTLEVSNFAVIGHGSGGAIATEMVLMAPARVQGLVMLNSFVGFEPQVNCVKYQGFMAQVANIQAMPTALATSLTELFFSKDAMQLSQQNGALAQAIEQFNQQLTDINAVQVAPLLKFANMAIFKRDTLESVEALTLPTLIAVGLNGYLRTALESYLMHDCIDGSQLLHIDQAGHLANIEQPDFFNQHLIDFLSKVNFN
ncbi:alpha/beta fold hydrolase [Shewanella saliphila]|uniref:2-succinyl-6-hydroxy-2, 4-cyclohexadiene-1-carboxylate synthase n=1 Tax=Shewanella saliphila TaxID=2282698 RepID=A0ABQ2QAQ7_9GAMM|nr:alpha/beta hydrolase [Shewanella saliphila]MCL1102791.1 alpha/beta hydrolase [Shewanella saliphila]GGP61380.1 2-succinyl-6-hydroxy-2,4-cyclohexadiene-1-carboxylate synthase [Shewanella saliphila]